MHISISDRGIGIDPDDLPHIFEPFYRSPSVRVAQIHGTGLGLALAKQVAESMGGALTVTSVPGHGSTFTLSLRCPTPGAAQNAAETSPERPVYSLLDGPPGPRGDDRSHVNAVRGEVPLHWSQRQARALLFPESSFDPGVRSANVSWRILSGEGTPPELSFDHAGDLFTRRA